MTANPNLNSVSTIHAEAAVGLLQHHPDYRIIRRIGEPVDLAVSASEAQEPLRVGIAIDVESTGLNPQTDVVIEIAMQRFRFDRAGNIVEVGVARTWREDPGFALPAKITQITGLRDEDLAGQVIDTAAATEILTSADIVVAHNALFDRGFVEARLPAAAGLPWGCSMREVDWQELGFEGRSLSFLLMQMGWFYPPHRAEIDVAALLHLLSHACKDGERILAKLVAKAERPTVRIDALKAPFEIKDVLKERGYRWDSAKGNWWIEVADDAVESEQLWLQRNKYLRTPELTTITARERHL